MADHDMDIDDENDWKAMDSDEEEDDNHIDNDGEEQVERDDDIDIGFRSHQFQYGSHGRKRKRSRKQNQEEAIYGVFYDSDDGNHRNRNRSNYDPDHGVNTAPVFVPATKTPEPSQAPPLFVSATKKDTAETAAPMFVAASKTAEPQSKMDSTSTEAAPVEAFSGGSMFVAVSKSKPKDEREPAAETNAVKDEADEDAEEEKRIQIEQQQADNRFLELLEKAKARNKRTRPRSRPPQETTTTTATSSASSQQHPPNEFGGIGGGLGMSQGLGLPSSFGGGGGLGFSAASAMEDDDKPVQKDPTVGTWEKHTKGFGSKLLAKMGWKGSGGLGSNRRTFRGEAAKGESEATAKDSASATADAPSSAAAATTAAPSVKQGVKKGISRPVEVVVRPTNMGLGFGNFKESSQLKANRRIEAEVRGIDYDAQLAKEKEEARAKRRQKRKQRYGNQYASSSSDEDDDDQGGSISKNVRSSAIPTTDDLLSKQSWKAKRSKARGKHKKQKGLPEIIPYQELIKRQNQSSGGDKVVIIDMRGPSSGQTPKPSSSKGQPVPLGEELLYNLSFLLGTYENKLHSSSRHHETSILRTIQGLDNQIQDAEDRIQKAGDRRTKLVKAHEIAESVRTEITSQTTNAKRQRVSKLVFELRDVFTPSERKELQFWNVLAPTLLGPTMQSMLENWKPFFGDSESSNLLRSSDRAVVDSFFEWAASSDNKEGRILCESMVKNQLIPKLKADIEAQAFEVWDPVANPYAALDLYEYIRAKALAFDSENSISTSGSIQNEDDDPNQVFPSQRGDDAAEELEKHPSSHLAEHIQNNLIREAVYPKLLAAITNWKPVLPRKHGEKELQYPLHSWVLPWLPHIDHPILLPNLLVECKRKLKHALSVLQGGGRSNMEYSDIPLILEVLRPWCAILDSKSLQRLLFDHTNLFSRYENLVAVALAGDPIEGNDWKSLRHLLFDLHGNHLLSDVDFLTLFECFLEGWASHVHFFLIGGNKVLLPLNDDFEEPEDPKVLESAVDAYRECKIHVLIDPLHGSEKKPSSSSSSSSRSVKLLQRDEYTCRIFYSVARMIQIYHQSQGLDPKEIEEKLDFIGTQKGFNAIRRRRLLEEKEKSRAAQAGESREESRTKAALRKRNILEPTFREVVEAFASDRGVVFRPKSGAQKDGKPIYLFGKKAIYLEGDVVFYQDDSNKTISWRPISLDQLGTMAS